MPLKVIQHMFTSTMERLVAEGDLIADTRTALIRYSHSHDIETLLGQKKPSPIIPLTVLFDGLHGNNASREAFFTASVLLCAVIIIIVIVKTAFI